MMKGVVLRYVNCEADADDLLQISFIRVVEKLHLFQNTGALGGWIRKTTVNCILGELRKNKMFLMEQEKIEYLMPIDTSFLEELDASFIVSLIQELPESYRVVFNLFAIEGYAHKEISEKLNIPENTSKSHYHRAKQMLRQLIENSEKKTVNNLNYG